MIKTGQMRFRQRGAISLQGSAAKAESKLRDCCHLSPKSRWKLRVISPSPRRTVRASSTAKSTGGRVRAFVRIDTDALGRLEGFLVAWMDTKRDPFRSGTAPVARDPWAAAQVPLEVRVAETWRRSFCLMENWRTAFGCLLQRQVREPTLTRTHPV